MLALVVHEWPGDRRHQSRSQSDQITFDLLLAAELSLDQIEARPGNVLVPVRNPHSLAHVAAALQTAGDRDVVVMTARLLDVDVSEESAGQSTPDADERRLLSDVVALAERLGRPVRLLIVPARNVVDAIVATVLRLHSSEVYVGESATLSAADQARLLGEAWERADKPEALDVRLVIHHRSGRTDTYHLGAHPPSLTPGDLDLIHRVWLDAVKAVGPHVHHHDVVRAALTQMEQQLTGPDRDEAARGDPRTSPGPPTSSRRSCARATTRGCATWSATGTRATSPSCSPRSASKTRSSCSACSRARTPPRCSSTSRRTQRKRC